MVNLHVNVLPYTTVTMTMMMASQAMTSTITKTWAQVAAAGANIKTDSLPSFYNDHDLFHLLDLVEQDSLSERNGSDHSSIQDLELPKYSRGFLGLSKDEDCQEQCEEGYEQGSQQISDGDDFVDDVFDGLTFDHHEEDEDDWRNAYLEMIPSRYRQYCKHTEDFKPGCLIFVRRIFWEMRECSPFSGTGSRSKRRAKRDREFCDKVRECYNRFTFCMGSAATINNGSSGAVVTISYVGLNMYFQVLQQARVDIRSIEAWWPFVSRGSSFGGRYSGYVFEEYYEQGLGWYCSLKLECEQFYEVKSIIIQGKQ